MPDVSNVELRSNLAGYLVFLRHGGAVVGLFKDQRSDLTDLEFNDGLDERCNVILRQVVDIVIPVADTTFLLPFRKFAWPYTPKVSHKHIEAGSVCQVRR